ncbi:His Kinase A (phospho-acceptor) domain-containing protein [Eubacterium pyruvativorans]|uniref:histidine kinase n=1 Tax=Eubacterium pyruvativorans TaxID=155865 RepID=A0A1I7FHW2_9FIRM|nr:HAMP domain-containing sensor histidine kinase [Eubacterium pyruvativorans]SFN83113.1 His Kinase A (phospho-acceptor) domain-containing protein [Eubacterium pyruvativorans]SFU35773.1 His Kinase A (phospho-acceptor) domain-containing protein [Eubacterium pyruvativorans]
MNEREIEKLRKRFIMIAMLSFLIVTMVIGGAAYFVTYFTSRNLIRDTLDKITAAEGNEVSLRSGDDSAREPRLTDVFRRTSGFRFYFVAVFNSEGKITSFRTSMPVEDKALYTGYAKKLRKANGEIRFGRYGKYYFQVKKRSGGLVVAVLDCGQEVDMLSRLLYIILMVSAAGLLGTFFIVRALSKRAVQPEIEINRRQKQFITDASHELKTPLAVIRANTELEQMMNGENEWNQSTIEQVDRMNGLIQNLVMITRAQEQENSGEAEPVDAAQAVRESVEPYRSLALQQQKELREEIPDSLAVTADGSRIRQLTTILVDNALKYCDDGGSIFVRLAGTKKDRGIVLTVSNSFAAGETVDYARFFDRFYRADSSHSIDHGGYGIGLSIAESICSRYHGSIRADWKDGMISFRCVLYL